MLCRHPRSFAVVLSLTAAPAWAHPGHLEHAAGFATGLIHPLLGADHLLTMLIIGVWAAQLGGTARWTVPASFMALLAGGAIVGTRGLATSGAESAIWVSLVMLGALVVSARLLPAAIAASLAGGLAIAHGIAHGAEIPASIAAAPYFAGFLVSSAALHAVGYLIGRLRIGPTNSLARLAGAAGIATGLAYALG